MPLDKVENKSEPQIIVMESSRDGFHTNEWPRFMFNFASRALNIFSLSDWNHSLFYLYFFIYRESAFIYLGVFYLESLHSRKLLGALGSAAVFFSTTHSCEVHD